MAKYNIFWLQKSSINSYSLTNDFTYLLLYFIQKRINNNKIAQAY